MRQAASWIAVSPHKQWQLLRRARRHPLNLQTNQALVQLAAVSLGVGALMALSKSKKHFIGITWDDNGKKGGLAFQADKNDYRGPLAALEEITGKKAVNSDAMTVKN